MPLNYSKWDNLELSDDSDIEEHPNVDKASMIRWKQRDIHEKREQRKLNILKLKSEIELNGVLRPRIQAVVSGLEANGVSHFRAVQRRIKEQPSDEKPATNAPNQPTYDMMLGQLLGDVWREAAWLVDGDANVVKGGVYIKGRPVNEKTGEPAWSNEATVPDAKQDTMKQALLERLTTHIGFLDARDVEIKLEIAKEEEEMAKKITSDGMHDGWDSSAVTKATPSVLDKPSAAAAPAKKAKEKVETIEVLNPGSSSSAAPATETVAAAAADDEDEDDVPSLTPSARAFANIPMGDFEASYKFIQNDQSVLSESTHDGLLLEAFEAERRGNKALAKRCVHQSLLVNYCRELGRDGVGLFFQRMVTKNPKSLKMFSEDFARTYGHVERRSKELAAEAEQEREQIQLVAEDPSVTIGFNIPDGPPPAELKLEGEGADELDMDQVRAFLERKWEIFQGFPKDLQTALNTEKLDEVNKVLGKMKVADAENVVELMQEGGMLSFSEEGVRDMTK